MLAPTKFPHSRLPSGPPWPKPRLVGLAAASISPWLGIDPLSLGQPVQPCGRADLLGQTNMAHHSSHHARSSLRSRPRPMVAILITTSVQTWACSTLGCSLGTKCWVSSLRPVLTLGRVISPNPLTNISTNRPTLPTYTLRHVGRWLIQQSITKKKTLITDELYNYSYNTLSCRACILLVCQIGSIYTRRTIQWGQLQYQCFGIPSCCSCIDRRPQIDSGRRPSTWFLH